jgi:hypothetical protein
MELIGSKEAKKMLAMGFKGNGCGSGFFSKKACYVLLLMLPRKQQNIMFLLQDIFDMHDAEYNISRALKSRFLKNKADSSLRINLEDALGINELTTGFKPLFVNLIHSALIWGGDSSYWT